MAKERYYRVIAPIIIMILFIVLAATLWIGGRMFEKCFDGFKKQNELIKKDAEISEAENKFWRELWRRSNDRETD